jgi:DNA-binding PadR family transcriptional regulator
MFAVGLAIFTVASAGAAVSASADALIAARALQGLGAAIVLPLTLTLLSEAVPPARRGMALGIRAGESQYYTEPKRLARLGYLTSRKAPGRTRERTVYTLTDNGLRALRDYAATPVTFTPLKSDPLVRLSICDLVGEDVTRHSMASLRDDIADIQARLGDAEETARELPHRERYLRLVITFMRHLLELPLDLVDQVDRELAPGKPKPAPKA